MNTKHFSFLMKFRLEPGDLIYTGTPAGVGPIKRGDQVEALVSDLPPLRFTLV